MRARLASNAARSPPAAAVVDAPKFRAVGEETGDAAAVVVAAGEAGKDEEEGEDGEDWEEGSEMEAGATGEGRPMARA